MTSSDDKVRQKVLEFLGQILDQQGVILLLLRDLVGDRAKIVEITQELSQVEADLKAAVNDAKS